jgi:hypothetical protein
LILQFFFWAVISSIYLPKKWLKIFFFSLAFLLPLWGYVQRWLLSNSWRTTNEVGQIEQVGINNQGMVTSIQASEQGRDGVRSWRLEKGTESLEMRFEARLLQGSVGSSWLGDIGNLETLQQDNFTFTRWNSPSSKQLKRRYYTEKPLGGKTFRIHLQLKSPLEGCGRIRLTEQPGKTRFTKKVCVTQQWQLLTYEWVVPVQAQGSFINLILDQFNTSSLDLTDIRLEQTIDGNWILLSPPSPIGMGIGFLWPGRPPGPSPEYRFWPQSEWQSFSFTFNHPTLRTQERLLTYIDLEPSLSIEVRNLELYSLTAGKQDPIPLPREIRQTLFSPHPNLAGHMMTVIGISSIAISHSTLLANLVFVASLAGVWLTGSRAGFLGLILAFPLLLYFVMIKRRWLIYGLITLVLVGSVATIGFERLGRLIKYGGETTSRPEIWQVAWQALREYPLTGLSPQDFKAYAFEQGVGIEVGGVDHAHNFWLYLASSYGVFGLLASLWLTAGLLFFAWQVGKLRALTFLIPILFLNIFDVSLIYAGVFIPTVLMLNHWRVDYLCKSSLIAPNN